MRPMFRVLLLQHLEAGSRVRTGNEKRLVIAHLFDFDVQLPHFLHPTPIVVCAPYSIDAVFQISA